MCRNLTITLFTLVSVLMFYSPVFAQSKDELNELLNSSSTETKSSKNKPKTKEKSATETQKTESTKTAEAPTQNDKPQTANPEPQSGNLHPVANSAPSVNRSSEIVKELPEPEKIGWRKNRKLGDKLYGMGSVYNAVVYYTEAAKKKPTKPFLFQKAADGFFMLRDYGSANAYYKKLMELDTEKNKYPMAIYQYALTEKYMGNYEVAKTFFEKFKQTAKADEWSAQRSNAGREIQGCDLGLSYLNSTQLPEYTIEHLRENVNQPFTDYAPVLQGNTLYFGAWTSDKVVMENKREKYADFSRIYVSQKNGSEWSNAEMLNSTFNNVNFHVGNPAFSSDGKTLYYTQCYQDEYGQMQCSIYKSTNLGSGWSDGEKLDAGVNAANSSNTHPCMGKNEAGEDGLYFSSNRNTNRGFDILFAKQNGSGFDKARTVANINTKGDEWTPFYDYKNNTLYFSSNGHINISGADIYKTTLERGEWSEPKNLGLPINSSVDDMYFHWSESNNTGFVVSNRPGGFGQKSETCCDDIYQLFKTKLNFAVAGTVQNANAGYSTIENCLVTLYDAKQGTQIKSAYPEKGQYFFDLEPEREYKIMARKNGFEDMLLSISTVGKKKSDTVTLDFPMKGMLQTLSYLDKTIGVVYWEFNADRLTNGAPDTLNNVVTFMTANPQCVVEVGSHTDSKGTDEYNLKLSQRRSDAVAKYLMSKKVQQFRIVSKAYGESMPLELNENPPGTDNPEGRSKNRRTEFKVVKELTQEELNKAGNSK